MKISKTDLSALIHEDIDDTEPWRILDNSVIDEWRWGTVSQIALEHKDTGEKYGYTYREQTGDNYYNSIEDLPDDGEIELYPIETEMVVRYRRAK